MPDTRIGRNAIQESVTDLRRLARQRKDGNNDPTMVLEFTCRFSSVGPTLFSQTQENHAVVSRSRNRAFDKAKEKSTIEKLNSQSGGKKMGIRKRKAG